MDINSKSGAVSARLKIEKTEPCKYIVSGSGCYLDYQKFYIAGRDSTATWQLSGVEKLTLTTISYIQKHLELMFVDAIKLLKHNEQNEKN